MSFVYQNKASEARKKEQDSLFGLPAIEGLRQAISAQGYIAIQRVSQVYYGLPYKYGRRRSEPGGPSSALPVTMIKCNILQLLHCSIVPAREFTVVIIPKLAFMHFHFWM